MIGQRRAKL